MVIKMDLNIRKNIIENTKKDSVETLISSLNNIIPTDDELVLPGFGVFFELLWQDLNDKEKKDIISKIKKKLI